MKWDAVTTKYEELCSSVEHRVDFDNKKTACLGAEVISVVRNWDASVPKVEQLSHGVQRNPGLLEECKKFCGHVSTLKTA